MRGVLHMIRQFGIGTTGAAYAARLYSSVVPHARWKATSLHLGGVPKPVWIRPGTSDWRVLHQVFAGNEYDSGSDAHEAAVAGFYEDALARSEVPVIVDCGANVGLASIWYAVRFPRAQIIAVEPEPENFRILAMNARNYQNIMPVQGGISDRPTRASLTNAGSDPWAWETQENDEDGEVMMVTVQDLLAKVPNAQPLIVKIDIEGAERELFRSNLHWTRDTPLIVFESHDRRFAWRGTFHAIASALLEQPRDYIQQGENTFTFSHVLRNARPRSRRRA